MAMAALSIRPLGEPNRQLADHIAQDGYSNSRY